MRYAKWRLTTSADEKYAFGPEMAIASAGGYCQAEVSLTPDIVGSEIIGYIDDACEVSSFEDWGLSILTQEEFLSLAQEVNSAYSLNPEGRLRTQQDLPGGSN